MDHFTETGPDELATILGRDAGGVAELVRAWEAFVGADPELFNTVSPAALFLEDQSGIGTAAQWHWDPTTGDCGGIRPNDVLWYDGADADEVLDGCRTTEAGPGDAGRNYADPSADLGLPDEDEISSLICPPATERPEWAIEGDMGVTADEFIIREALEGCEPNLIRAPDDLYTPRWIRGIGRDKEGLCPRCADNGELNWRRMKCSAYWYHLNYFHGVSSLTGRPFPEPLAVRTTSTATRRKRREGRCGICDEWVFIDSARNVNINVPEIYWWKHVQGCIKRTWQDDDSAK